MSRDVRVHVRPVIMYGNTTYPKLFDFSDETEDKDGIHYLSETEVGSRDHKGQLYIFILTPSD